MAGRRCPECGSLAVHFVPAVYDDVCQECGTLMAEIRRRDAQEGRNESIEGPTNQDLAELAELEQGYVPYNRSSFVPSGHTNLLRGHAQASHSRSRPSYLSNHTLYMQQKRRRESERQIYSLITDVLHRLKSYGLFQRVKDLFLQAHIVLHNEEVNHEDREALETETGAAVRDPREARFTSSTKALIVACIFAILRPIRADLTIEHVWTLSGTGTDGTVTVRQVHGTLQRIEKLLGGGSNLLKKSYVSPNIYLDRHFAFLERQMRLKPATPGYGVTSRYLRRKTRQAHEEGGLLEEEEEESVLPIRDHLFLAQTDMDNARELALGLSSLCEQEGLRNRASNRSAPFRDYALSTWAIILLSLEASTHRVVGRQSHKLASAIIFLSGWKLGSKGKGRTKAELGIVDEHEDEGKKSGEDGERSAEKERDSRSPSPVEVDDEDEEEEEGVSDHLDATGTIVTEVDRIRRQLHVYLTKWVWVRSKQINRMVTGLAVHLPWLSSTVKLDKKTSVPTKTPSENNDLEYRSTANQVSLATLSAAEMARCLPDVIQFQDILRSRRARQNEPQRREINSNPSEEHDHQEALSTIEVVEIIQIPTMHSFVPYAEVSLHAKTENDRTDKVPALWVSQFGSWRQQTKTHSKEEKSRLEGREAGRGLSYRQGQRQGQHRQRPEGLPGTDDEEGEQGGGSSEDEMARAGDVRLYQAITASLFDDVKDAEAEAASSKDKGTSQLAQSLRDSSLLRTQGQLETMLDSVVDSVLFRPDEMDSYLRGFKEGEREEVELIRKLRWSEWLEGEQLSEAVLKRKERKERAEKLGVKSLGPGTKRPRTTKGDEVLKRLEGLEAGKDPSSDEGDNVDERPSSLQHQPTKAVPTKRTKKKTTASAATKDSARGEQVLKRLAELPEGRGAAMTPDDEEEGEGSQSLKRKRTTSTKNTSRRRVKA